MVGRAFFLRLGAGDLEKVQNGPSRLEPGIKRS